MRRKNEGITVRMNLKKTREEGWEGIRRGARKEGWEGMRRTARKE